MQSLARKCRRHRTQNEASVAKDLLLRGVWGFHSESFTPAQTAAYLNFWKDLLSDRDLLDGDTLTLHLSNKKVQDTVELVEFVRTRSISTLEELGTQLRAWNPAWLADPTSNDIALRAVDFALRLWLMTVPVLENTAGLIKDATQKSLPQKKANKHARLSSDFSAKSLTRKGGFLIVWTSYLSNHLLVDDNLRLQVFRHANVLVGHSQSRTRDVYPDGFLEETQMTLALLFPTGRNRDIRRAYRISGKSQVDIEAAMAVFESFNLNDYEYWGERLAIVQQKYDATQPKRLRQWWFDRRNRIEWTTFIIAVVVFFLTVFFGVIGIVTSVLQVLASFRSVGWY